MRNRRQRNLCVAGVLAAVASAPGCGFQIERYFPDMVGVGVARLTVRNAAKLTGYIADDRACGFESEAVKESYLIEGEVGGFGTLTYTVTDCVLDFGIPSKTDSDCNDTSYFAGGKAVVTAQQRVYGRLTGNPDNPVIPNNPTRKHPHPFDERLYRARNRIERTIGHLKDWRRIATRYDRLSSTYASAVALALLITWWC